MKVSTRARYGLRGLFDIAYHNAGRPTQVKDIARRQGVTPRYLEQIFQTLKKAGMIAAQRGPKGGYYLARRPEEISLGDVVRATEGPIQLEGPAEEATERPPSPEDAEGVASRALTSAVWAEVGREIEALLDGITLATLCARAEAEGVPRSHDRRRLMYFI